MNKRYVHSIFRSIASARPDSVAIRSAEGEIRYADLLTRVDQLAVRIRGQGIGDGSFVAIDLPESIDLVVSMLAAWSCGTVYFPIGQEWPEARTRSLLERVSPALVLCLEKDAGKLERLLAAGNPSGYRPNILLVDNPPASTSSPQTEESQFNTNGDGDEDAYLLFTSGSTGEPKGILGRHKSLSHFIHWEMKEFGIGPEDRVSLLAPPTFDVSLRDMLVPLLSGGCLCIPPEGVKRSPGRLLEWLEREEVTTIHLVPSLMRLLEQEARDQNASTSLRAVKHLLLAGEPLFGADVNRWRETFGDSMELVNLYGPSESTLAKLYQRIEEGPLPSEKMVPVGKPISNTAVLILRDGALCRIGEEGEVHIKTPFLSNGYFGLQEANRASFVDNPLNPEEEDILFRTGDLGCYLPDRSVVLHGRLDMQVKIHGNRVEPGEIESLLVSYEGIQQAAVLPEEQVDHSWSLSAFYTSDGELNGEELGDWLGQHLPAYMVPGRFFRLDSLPLTSHGKMDRHALTKLSRERQQEQEYLAPETEAELILAEIWREVIGLDRVGASSHFFEIGGHSLHAIRVVARLQRATGIELSIQQLFGHPVLRDCATLLDSLTPKTEATIPHLPDSEEGYPLSPSQRRLWTLFQIDPGSLAYTIQSGIRLEGELDQQSLRTAWQMLVERHEVLRSRYVLVGDEPRMKVDPPRAELPMVDLSSEVDPEATATIEMERLSGKPFDLTTGPLVRIALYRIGEENHLLALQLHHIVADAWSLDVLAGELQQLYNSLRSGEDTDLPALPFHYRDYASWARDRLQQQGVETSLGYWTRKLADAPVPAELPGDRTRPMRRSFKGGTIFRSLDQATQNSLESASRRYGTTPFSILLTALKVLVYRLSGERDVIVGTTVANRTIPELENQVGFYVNTLALRDQLHPDQGFAELIQAVSQTVRDGFAQQDLPFDSVVEALDLPRDLARNPLFDIALIHHADRVTSIEMDGLKAAPIPVEEQSAKYDLLISFEQRHGEWMLEANYSSDLYDPETVERLLDLLTTTLSTGVAQPDTPIGDLPLLSGTHLEQVQSFGVGEQRPEWLGKTVPEIFLRQVGRTPDATALIKGSSSWSYAELQRDMQRISTWLRAEKVEHGSVIGVQCERSPEGIAALLAILQAGCVYLPLEPDLPAERLAWMLRDSGCKLVLHDGCSTAAIPDDVNRVALSAMKNNGVDGESSSPGSSDLAYIIYTSGTTGTPKGVMVEHGGFCNMIAAQIEAWEVAPASRVLQFASWGFDAALSEIFMALFSGAALVLADRDTLLEPDQFARLMEREQITTATLPPVYQAALGKRSFPSLRTLISAGEAAEPSLLAFHSETATCWNAYGPTECSVCATMYRYSPAGQSRMVPIGSPIPNGEALVLDARGNLLPVGIPGELCLGGVGVARGYLNDPERTKRLFPPHPVGVEGQRIYRTGDRVRWLADGNLEYLGRIDNQVKIRGHRVEPAEVSRHLLDHPSIADAVAAPLGSDSGGELVAWTRTRRRPELWPSVAEFYVYDDILYRAMYTDEERNSRYRAAFEAALPGKTVLEIGPGPVAILARMAIEAGARKVYAVELLEESWRKAKARVAELGLQDQIELIHGDIRTVTLPEKVDACISEIVGAIGGSEGSAKLINEARRFLNDPAAMIPSRSLTWMAAMELPDDPDLLQLPDIATHYISRIFEEAGRPFDLRMSLKHVDSSLLLSDRGPIEDLDYTRPVPLEASHKVELEVKRDGICHGILAWMELFTDPDHSIDILEHAGSWLPVFLPLSDEPFEVRAGDSLHGRVDRTLYENGLNPEFTVKGELHREGSLVQRFTVEAKHISPGFRTTPFHHDLFDEKGLVRSIPEANATGLRRFLQDRLPDYMIPSRFIEVESIPQTAHGKVDFEALRVLAAEETHEIASKPPVTEKQQTIAEVVEQVTGSHLPGVDQDLFAYGLDSIRAIQMVARLKEAGLHLDVRDIFNHPTIERLAEIARESGRSIDQGPVTGNVPLGPIQEWFFDTHHACPHHFNQSMLLAPSEPLDTPSLQATLDSLVDHHDGLRLVVKQGVDQPELVIQPFNKAHLVEVDLRGEEDALSAMQDRAQQLQSDCDLDRGPLFRAVLFHLPKADRLLLIAHHLLVDGISWRILLEDLERGYRMAMEGDTPIFAAKTDSLITWMDALQAAADTGEFEEERSFWTSMNQADVQPLPHASSDGQAATRADSEVLHASLEVEQTHLLLTAALGRYGTETTDLLLTALLRALKQWTGTGQARLALEGHGREELFDDVDVTRTVGWFTSLYPVLLDIDESEEIGWQVRTIKESLRAIPNRGIGYGVLRYLADPPLFSSPASAISFNYLGQTGTSDRDTFFQMSDEPAGLEIGLKSELEAEIALVCAVVKGELRIDLRFNRTLFTHRAMERLLEDWIGELRSLIQHCMESGERELTPSDLTYDGFSMQELDDFLDDIDLGEEE
ncbi:amino acid adenylation domain-containing protein [bacterium]|nr:amino acid adenylation domain-containing protein [bacterium]